MLKQLLPIALSPYRTLQEIKGSKHICILNLEIYKSQYLNAWLFPCFLTLISDNTF